MEEPAEAKEGNAEAQGQSGSEGVPSVDWSQSRDEEEAAAGLLPLSSPSPPPHHQDSDSVAAAAGDDAPNSDGGSGRSTPANEGMRDTVAFVCAVVIVFLVSCCCCPLLLCVSSEWVLLVQGVVVVVSQSHTSLVVHCLFCRDCGCVWHCWCGLWFPPHSLVVHVIACGVSYSEPASLC